MLAITLTRPEAYVDLIAPWGSCRLTRRDIPPEGVALALRLAGRDVGTVSRGRRVAPDGRAFPQVVFEGLPPEVRVFRGDLAAKAADRRAILTPRERLLLDLADAVGPPEAVALLRRALPPRASVRTA